MTTFVLIPGAWHGGWCFDELVQGLRAQGHHAVPVTLTGIAERAHLLHAGVNLETHIQDALAVIAAEHADQVVLVGHSYGGMVITAVADRIPEQVDSLVFIDAFVPEDGESCWTLTTDEQREQYVSVDESGYGVPPMPFFDSRATAHPLASLLQPVRLAGDLSGFRRREFLYAEQWPGESPLAKTYAKLKDDPLWNTHSLDGAHNLMRDKPDELLRILLDGAAAPE